MEALALQPRVLARQAHAATSARPSQCLRPTRVAMVFSGRRTLAPRSRITAAIAAADVETSQEVATEDPSVPAERSRPAGEGFNGGIRRRDGNQNQNRKKKLDVKYKISDLVVGMEVEGVVGGTTAFGAFVDIGLGGKDALVHISQLADGFVKDVTEVVQPGQTVKARIHNLDMASGRVGLTMRSAESQQEQEERATERSERSQAPMQARAARRAPREKRDFKYPPVGEEITGTVDAVMNFGVFVKLPDDLRALLHAEEMATEGGREPNIRAMFTVGDEIKVRVMKVDAKARRVDLTQRSEEERQADKALAEVGARTVKVSGMNTLEAALARAGIRKQDFEDLSKAPEEESSEASPAPAAAATEAPTADSIPVEEEPAAEPSPTLAGLKQEESSTPIGPQAAPDVEEAAPVVEEPEQAPAPEAASAPTGGEEAPALEEPTPASEATSAPTGGEATPVIEEPEQAAAPEPEVAPVAEAPMEPEQAPAPEVAPAAEEPQMELDPEAFPAAETSSAGSEPASVAEAPAEMPAAPQAASIPTGPEAAPEASKTNDSAPAAFKVDAKSAKALRDQTGAGMMDAKKALVETQGNVEAAVEWLRKKGLSGADKKAGRVASEGVIASYIHAGSRLGVLVELNCETDFVARGDKFKELVSDMAMQIAASGEVSVVSVDDVPADIKQKEFDIEMGKEDIQSKPEQIRPKIVEGRVAKTLKTMALLEQAFIKDTDKDVASVIKEATAALGEKIQVRRFEKFVLGEGIEKKTNDLAKEVEAQTKAFEEAAAKKAASAADSAAAPAQEAAAEPAQVKVDAKAVKQLRQASGAGMMDAKKALLETQGDVDAAMELLRKKGLASADKKSGRLASEGAIGSYIHAGSRLGVLVEVNCETDFVARGDTFKELVQDIAMQIAASPTVDIVSIDEAPQEDLERERAQELQKEDIQSKPEAIRGKIVEGRVQKIFKERALLEQAFIKDTSKTVADHIKSQVATIGENIQVRRFARFVLGEGIEKKQENFAAEIAAATGQAP